MTDAAASSRDSGAAAPTLDAVEEVPVWLEVNGASAVTWMCTPAQLDELVIGWLHGEGYIASMRDVLRMRPCADELGFRVEVPIDRYETVEGSDRRRVLASGCGAVTSILGSLRAIERREVAPPPLELARTRLLFKELFARGERYKETGGIHAAALTDGEALLHHAEDIGRHNAVDKVIGAAILDGRVPADLTLLVTGRISGELAHKAARARIATVATPSVPSSLAVDIARAAGMQLVGRAVSGQPQVWLDSGVGTRNSAFGT
ncbi:MAG: formate dehydrogenase accessory sulfurtransferase FdhD, partial [Gemmatimonadaceae bacterium]